jgi:hypothetical protein
MWAIVTTVSVPTVEVAAGAGSVTTEASLFWVFPIHAIFAMTI